MNHNAASVSARLYTQTDLTYSDAVIPLEDNFNDILGKAQRGLKLTDDQLAQGAGISPEDVRQARAGRFDERVARKLAPVLGLGADALVDIGNKAWQPVAHTLTGLASFNTPFDDMTVNAYLVWDPKTRDAAAFDTGSDCDGIVEFAKRNNLAVNFVFLTHTHTDHIYDLARLKKATKAKALVSKLETVDDAETFDVGKSFKIGNLQVETRLTSGHSRGGTTYVVTGLEKPVAVVGDSLFAGSMGGGMVSYEDALRNNREKILSLPDDTVICPGHGPLTTVGEEKSHNPFFPEFSKPRH